MRLILSPILAASFRQGLAGRCRSRNPCWNNSHSWNAARSSSSRRCTDKGQHVLSKGSLIQPALHPWRSTRLAFFQCSSKPIMPALPSLRLVSLLISNILIPIACLIFATGFFPYKPFLPGLATFQEAGANEELGLLKEIQRPPRVFDKVIFMVVDALRRWVESSSRRQDTERAGQLRRGARKEGHVAVSSPWQTAEHYVGLEELATKKRLHAQENFKLRCLGPTC